MRFVIAGLLVSIPISMGLWPLARRYVLAFWWIVAFFLMLVSFKVPGSMPLVNWISGLAFYAITVLCFNQIKGDDRGNKHN